MQKDIIVVDNFYKNPEAVVAYAKQLAYYYPYQLRTAVESNQQYPTWMASRFINQHDCPFRSSETLIQTFEQITGDQIERSYWERDLSFENSNAADFFYDNFAEEKIKRATIMRETHPNKVPAEYEVSMWNAAFQVKLQWDVSEAIHHHIDDYWQCCGELGWSALVYLNESSPVRAGTKFWRNKYGDNREWMTDHDRWELIDDIGNVYNRLVLFRGYIAHSGTPGFGSDIETGRLFQTFFFRTINPETINPVAIDF